MIANGVFRGAPVLRDAGPVPRAKTLSTSSRRTLWLTSEQGTLVERCSSAAARLVSRRLLILPFHPLPMELQALLLESLCQRQQNTSEPREAKQAGGGDHAFDQPPVLRQTEITTHGCVFVQGEVGGGALVHETVFPLKETRPHHDLQNVRQRNHPACQDAVGLSDRKRT